MATILSQINALQAQISSIKDNVTISNQQIAGLEQQITELRIQHAREESDFGQMRCVLRFGSNNMPMLVATQAIDIVHKINAIGIRPAAITIGRVVVTVSGTGVIISVLDLTQDVLDAAELLRDFAIEKGIVINADAAQVVKDGNVARANSFMELAELQSDIIAIMLEDTKQATIKPSLDVIEAVVDGKEVTIDFSATGTEPITFDIDWGDGDETLSATSPVTHEYTDWDTEYTITVTATNEAGSVMASKTITTDEEPVIVPPGTEPTLTNIDIAYDGRDVTITWDSTGTTPIVYTIDWGTGTPVTATSGVTKTFNWNDVVAVTLKATNAYGYDEQIINIDIGAEPTAPSITSVTIDEINGKEVTVSWTAIGDAPITYEIDWEGDGTFVAVSGNTATYEYSVWDTTFTAVLRATNNTGEYTRGFAVTIGEQPIAVSITSFVVDVSDDPTVTVTIGATGTPLPTQATVDWGNGNVETVGLDTDGEGVVQHTYNYNDAYTVQLTVNNGVFPPAMLTKAITITNITPPGVAPAITEFEIDDTSDPTIEVAFEVTGTPLPTQATVMWGYKDTNLDDVEEVVTINANGEGVASHTYDENDDYDITLIVDNGVAPPAMQAKPVTVANVV